MHQLLTDACTIYGIYDVCPNRLCGLGADSSYTFDHESNFVQRVAGGGSYSQKLWDFSGDTISVRSGTYVPVVSDLLNLCGLGDNWFVRHVGLGKLTVCVYAVERKKIHDNRDLILLVPTMKTEALMAWLAEAYVEHNWLSRLNVLHKGEKTPFGGQREFLALKTTEADGSVRHHFSYPLLMEEDCLTSAQFAGLVAAERISKAKMGASMAKIYAADSPLKGSVALNFIRECPHEYVEWGTVVGIQTIRWKTAKGDVDFDSPSKLRVIANPLMHAPTAHAIDAPACEASVQGRIMSVKADPSPGSFFVDFAIEFIRFLVPPELVHSLHPVDFEEILEKQNRPNQVAANIASTRVVAPYPENHGAFIKVEAGTGTVPVEGMPGVAGVEVKDPRIISNIKGNIKVDSAMLVYSLAVLIKRLPWYAFGQQPGGIARSVARCATNSAYMVETDFCRMDGTISAWFRQMIERPLFHAAFAPEHHDEVDNVLKSLRHCKFYFDSGVSYEQGDARASGEAGTSLLNTVIAAFVLYSTYRGMRSEGGEYFTPDQAWSELCNKAMAGGDDGAAGDLDSELFKTRSKQLGLRPKATLRLRGEKVSFLARHFSPRVWIGDPTSCADVPRQLSKLHVTASPLMPGRPDNVQLFVDKCYSYYLSDRNTPLLGDIVTKVVCLARNEGRPLRLTAEANYLTRESEDGDGQWPNDDADWVSPEIYEETGELYVPNAEHLLAAFCSFKDINECMHYDSPCQEVYSSEFDVVVGDDDHRVGGPAETQHPEAQPPPPVPKRLSECVNAEEAIKLFNDIQKQRDRDSDSAKVIAAVAPEPATAVSVSVFKQKQKSDSGVPTKKVDKGKGKARVASKKSTKRSAGYKVVGKVKGAKAPKA
jgi:hypothetical protein